MILSLLYYFLTGYSFSLPISIFLGIFIYLFIIFYVSKKLPIPYIGFLPYLLILDAISLFALYKIYIYNSQEDKCLPFLYPPLEPIIEPQTKSSKKPKPRKQEQETKTQEVRVVPAPIKRPETIKTQDKEQSKEQRKEQRKEQSKEQSKEPTKKQEQLISTTGNATDREEDQNVQKYTIETEEEGEPYYEEEYDEQIPNGDEEEFTPIENEEELMNQMDQMDQMDSEDIYDAEIEG